MFALVNFSNILFILRVKEFLLHVVLKKKTKTKNELWGENRLRAKYMKLHDRGKLSEPLFFRQKCVV